MIHKSWNMDIIKIYNSHFKHVFSGVLLTEVSHAGHLHRMPFTTTHFELLCKGQIFSGHTLKTCGAGTGTPLIHNCASRWKWVVYFTPWPIFPRRDLTAHWIGGLVGPKSWNWAFQRREKSLACTKIRASDCPAHIPSHYTNYATLAPDLLYMKNEL
jgi:hypothetical protein